MTLRKALLSYAIGDQLALLALARRTFRPYAERHGYDFFVRTSNPARDRPPPWGKVRMLQELAERYDVVVWIDADAVIVDPSKDIARELEHDRFLYLARHRYRDMEVPNTGVVMLRSGAETRDFLEATWNAEEYVNHPWWENAAVMDLLGYDVDRGVHVKDTPLLAGTKFIGNEWNSVRHDPASHPRITHYPGHTVPVRFAFMARDLARMRASRRS